MRLTILIAVTHLLGVGHLTRAAAIGRALTAHGHRVTLVSGGRPAPLVRTAGLDLVQLPAVHVRGTDFGTLLRDDGTPLDEAGARARIEALLAAFAHSGADVVITELYPLGRRVLAAEFQALLRAAAERPRRPLVLASVRDILAAPSKPVRLEEAHRLLREAYDGLLVHADPSLVPLDASWPLADDLHGKLHYTGYMDDAADAAEAMDDSANIIDAQPSILVSGGGSGAGRVLYEAALAAAAMTPDQPWHVLVGHGVPEDMFTQWRADAQANVTVERARPDFRALLRRCKVSVSQFGYNTALDLLATGARAVVVPFADGGETEQRQRAALFAGRGLLTVLDPEELSPASLNVTIAHSAMPPSRAEHPIAIDGMAETVRIVEELAHAQDLAHAHVAPGRPPAPRVAHAHRHFVAKPLTEALDRAQGAGQRIAFWWRDDDATMPTPRLERLLSLAGRHATPVAIAAIPALAEAELALRLEDDERADVLVHGLSHTNHQRADSKKSEFGDRKAHMSRPEREAALARAASGLEFARARFVKQIVPVLVPPWNRISPRLVPHLAELGYIGLSTARARDAALAAPGLIQVNSHIDPIDWHGSRSLRAPAELAADLAGAITLQSGQDTPEPIGLLTHHLVHDEPIWAFCEHLLDVLHAHPAAHVVAARHIFGVAEDVPEATRDAR